MKNELRLLRGDAIDSLTSEQQELLKARLLERLDDDYDNWAFEEDIILNCIAHLFFDYVEHVDSNARDWNQLTELEIKQFIERNTAINEARLNIRNEEERNQ